MARRILAFDLGTGGAKASLHAEDGACLRTAFLPYPTQYPASGWHEQRPEDWWNAVVEATRRLLAGEDAAAVEGLAISGQSLGVVPVDDEGRLLRAHTPIWSDTRASAQTQEFFQRVDPRRWYLTTGNGFPAECYAVFKAMWYRDQEPEMFGRVRWLLGSKDYVNLRLTGLPATDHSYASGSGIYDLRRWAYSPELLEASGLPGRIFPAPLPSTAILGGLTAEAAGLLGLRQGLPVACGGVDNSCMALGAKNLASGSVYLSLGSSAWIAVSSAEPVLDADRKPYVFAHVVPGLFTSAVSIFAAGSALRWVRDVLLAMPPTAPDGRDAYEVLAEMAARSPIGANRLLFNPSLAGGGSQEPSPDLRGGFFGLDLRHTRDDLVRAVLEGVALNLGAVLEILRGCVKLGGELLMVGGGSRSPLWRQILADVTGMRVVKTTVDQDAASLGAAAIAAVGTGLWKDFTPVEAVHARQSEQDPRPEATRAYARLLPVFERIRQDQATIGRMLRESGL
jgi:xylulokinase